MLTQQHQDELFERGFTRVSGLLPGDLRTKMVSRLWQGLEAEHGIRRDDQTTWIEGGIRGIGYLNREPEFQPFGSPEIDGVIDSLLGSGNWRRPSSWGQILATFPADGWSWNSLFQGALEVETIAWHTDYPYDTPPDELAGIQVFCLLADLEPGGGGTLVIEGSHGVIRRFVQRQPPETLRKMKRARQALLQSDPWLRNVTKAVSLPRAEPWIAAQRTELDGVSVAVQEMTGQAGDVYFSHPWLLHAASPNCNATPRLMCTQRIHKSSE
ncbi:MAG: phytanoyl-CoA dioxygenase family protein [Acidobacteriota bacterium]